MKKILLFPILLIAAAAQAQMPTDGLLVPHKSLGTAVMYQYDSWDNYWEGTLKRTNGNIGTVSTTALMYYGVYGVSPKVNVMATVPYITTEASMGTLHGMQGLQDLSVSAKYKAIDAKAGPGTLKLFGTASFSTPLSDYTPDFLPLSIGLASTTATARVNLNYTLDKGFYLNSTAAYTVRSNVTIDREEYYADGEYYSTNLVDMPNVFDYKFDLGYIKGPFQAELNYIQMVTLGGGDIRRQDMPFVSYRMNASKVGGTIMYYVPKPKNFGVRAMVTQTIAGRNVGQSFTAMGGIVYMIFFKKQDETSK